MIYTAIDKAIAALKALLNIPVKNADHHVNEITKHVAKISALSIKQDTVATNLESRADDLIAHAAELRVESAYGAGLVDELMFAIGR